jgi:hypothetical protein
MMRKEEVTISQLFVFVYFTKSFVFPRVSSVFNNSAKNIRKGSILNWFTSSMIKMLLLGSYQGL